MSPLKACSESNISKWRWVRLALNFIKPSRDIPNSLEISAMWWHWIINKYEEIWRNRIGEDWWSIVVLATYCHTSVFFPVKEPNMEITTPSHPPRRKPRISNFQKQIHWSCLWWLEIGFCAGWVDESLQKWWIHGGCPRLVASFSLVFGHRLGVPFSDRPTAWFLRAISGKPCLQVLHPSKPWGFSMFQHVSAMRSYCGDPWRLFFLRVVITYNYPRLGECNFLGMLGCLRESANIVVDIFTKRTSLRNVTKKSSWDSEKSAKELFFRVIA